MTGQRVFYSSVQNTGFNRVLSYFPIPFRSRSAS